MKTFINNLPTEHQKIGVNTGLNFGRFEVECIDELTIEVSKNELISHLQDEYDKILSEIRDDDQAYNDTSEFSKVNYCSLGELFADEAAFGDIFKTYLDRYFYEAVFTNTNSTDFIINITEKLILQDDKVVIICRCYRKKHN